MSSISRRVLCVDDDPNILQGIKRQFRREFDIVTANGGNQGLERLRADGDIAVVVTDHDMPDMKGVDFLRRAQEIAPNTVNVMLTGRADLEIAVAALHDGHIYRFVAKPCSRERFEKTITDCLEQYRLAASEQMLAEEVRSANQQLQRLNDELELRVAERTSTVQSLFRFVSSLNGLDSLPDVLREVIDQAAAITRSRHVSVMMPAGDSESLVTVAETGGDDRRFDRVAVGSRGPGLAFAENRMQVTTDGDGQSAGQESSSVCVPLRKASGPVGVLVVAAPSDRREYDEDDLAKIDALAEAAASAVSSQTRRQERNEAHEAIIMAMAKLAEHRDPETGAHLERVQVYCRMLSEQLARQSKYASQIEGHFIQDIVRSSPLHDIGKVGIPDGILMKPGPLTADEFVVMQRHATIGGDTIRGLIKPGRSQAFLRMGMEIAYYHHEKFNGSGYPKGLAGEEIPLPARILAVADVYDALTSHRIYKLAIPHEKSLEIIRADTGTHFDPVVVEAFLARELDVARMAVKLADRPKAPVDGRASSIVHHGTELVAVSGLC